MTASSSSPLLDDLTSKARLLLPGLRYAGKEGKGPEGIAPELLGYLVACLRGTTAVAPDLPMMQWGIFLGRLAPHWIAPFLHYRIHSSPGIAPPPTEIAGHLRAAFLRSRVRSEQMTIQLAELVELFARESIPLLVLKGPALAHGAYPDPATRPFSDLDLLVHPECVPAGRAILTGLGYRMLGQPIESSRSISHHESFDPPGDWSSHRHVELHWDLTKLHWGSWEERVQGLLDRSCEISAPGVSFRALHPVDALMHRALNNAWMHYRDLRLIWIEDFAALVAQLRGSQDWSLLEERSGEWAARRAVAVSLELARSWTGVEVPAQFDDSEAWCAKDPETRMWKAVTSRHERAMPYAVMLLRSSASLRQLLRMGVSLLFPPPAWMRTYHPPAQGWRLPLAYLRRWWKWFGGRA